MGLGLSFMTYFLFNIHTMLELWASDDWHRLAELHKTGKISPMVTAYDDGQTIRIYIA
jgi:hypothetical protein